MVVLVIHLSDVSPACFRTAKLSALLVPSPLRTLQSGDATGADPYCVDLLSTLPEGDPDCGVIYFSEVAYNTLI